MRKWIILSFFVLFGLTSFTPVEAQALPPPTILSFTATVAAKMNTEPPVEQVSINDVESGEFALTLSWQVLDANTTRHRLGLDAYRINQWQPITPPEQPERPWAFAESHTLDLQHPLNFGEPTYRLRLFEDDNVIEERYIVIPFATEPDQAPRISVFDAIPDTVDAMQLFQNTARVGITWAVTDRLPGSHLVFEQILDDGTVIDVELPRDNLWVVSAGEGIVAPMLPPQNRENIQLRLSLIDLATQTVYDQQLITVPISGVANLPASTGSNAGSGGTSTTGSTIASGEPLVPRPNPNRGSTGTTVSTASTPAAQAAQGTGNPAATQLPPAARNCTISPVEVAMMGTPDDDCSRYAIPETFIPVDYRGRVIEIEAFSADADTITPGGTITLTWAVTGASEAILEVYSIFTLMNNTSANPPAPDILLTGQPTVGSASVEIPDSYVSGAKIILWGADTIRRPRTGTSQIAKWAYQILELPAAAVASADEAGEGVTGADGTEAGPVDNADGDATPGATIITTQAAYQPFEGGFMVWKESDGAIWIFIKGGEFQSFSEEGYSALPENPITVTPPDGRSSPISGFGRIWGNIEPIRTALGWGLALEAGYTLALEIIAEGETPQYTLNLPDGRRVSVRGDGTWAEI